MCNLLKFLGIIEPFEEAIDVLQKEMKKRHVKRLRKGKCTAEMGFVLSDITNNYERIADHCSNLEALILHLHMTFLNPPWFIKTILTL